MQEGVILNVCGVLCVLFYVMLRLMLLRPWVRRNK